MRTFAVMAVTACSMAATQICLADEKDKLSITTDSLPTIKAPAEPGGAATDRNPAAKTSPREASPKRSADEEAILETGRTYAQAFNARDAKAIAAHYTSKAEYIDAEGNRYEGREAIERQLETWFKDHPRARLTLDVDSIRVIGPGVALEEGTTNTRLADDSESIVVEYAAVHIKQQDKWLTASVRESAVNQSRNHRFQLRQLDWMQGDWIHEGHDSIVRFSCRPVDGGNFLLRTFSVHAGGREVLTGAQRIGWDSHARKFRAWVFDSDGGYGEGYFHRDGDRWVLKQAGVTADGQPASSTSVYTPIGGQSMTFQSVDHEVGGEELADSEPVTIVRQMTRNE